jgi:hypothetical protein
MTGNRACLPPAWLLVASELMQQLCRLAVPMPSQHLIKRNHRGAPRLATEIDVATTIPAQATSCPLD